MGEVVARITLLCCFDRLAKESGIELKTDTQILVKDFLASLLGSVNNFDDKILTGECIYPIMRKYAVFILIRNTCFYALH